jgi:hypothetical protein
LGAGLARHRVDTLLGGWCFENEPNGVLAAVQERPAMTFGEKVDDQEPPGKRASDQHVEIGMAS